MEILKQLRKERGLTQKEVAQVLNITPMAYGNYELGQRTPTPAVLLKLADYFGVTVDFLLGRNELTPEEIAAGASLTRKESITPKEDDLLYEFRKLSPDMQDFVLKMLKSTNGEAPTPAIKCK